MRQPAAMRCRRRSIPAFLLLLACVVGCEEEATDTGEPRGVQPTVRRRAEAPAPSPYGPDGQLRESDTAVAGLTLPMGLELDFVQGRRHVYETRVPIDKVVAYFGPRLFTGQVDRVGDGAVYKAAVPKEAKGTAVKLDVSILPASTGTRVQIREIRPAPQKPPDREELQRRLEAQGGVFE